jgi:hypothetical protein
MTIRFGNDKYPSVSRTIRVTVKANISTTLSLDSYNPDTGVLTMELGINNDEYDSSINNTYIVATYQETPPAGDVPGSMIKDIAQGSISVSGNIITITLPPGVE